MSITYVALVHRAKKKNAPYGVMFPDFPGAVFAGETMNSALENAREGIVFHIDAMLDNGEILPEPSCLDAIEKNFNYHEATPALVKIILPTGHLKRLNISMDAGLLAEIDHAAKMSGKNRSQFLVDAARHLLA